MNAAIELSIIHDTLAVIPAKAGIQQDKKCILFKTHWIPAFAGMTCQFLFSQPNSKLVDALSSIMETSINSPWDTKRFYQCLIALTDKPFSPTF